MANAAAKKIANRNESIIKILKYGMILPTIISIALRFLFRRSSIPPSRGSIAIYLATFFPAFFLSHYLVKLGTPRRDPITNAIISYGEDLSQPGVTEWCFDIVYITWTCQIGSGAFGEWFWWLYMIIPLYAVVKLGSSFLSPLILGRFDSSGATEPDVAKEPTSKRQEKLRKRSERGDPRVKVQTTRR
ncbi:hypothetical protein AX16_000135 [Volvariella volvacea WC 439]|nr:hypothetical protein AX16_000135 [Volvariella volvacea WC 439]